jgi:glycerol uptake facilitator-like aquaporin
LNTVPSGAPGFYNQDARLRRSHRILDVAGLVAAPRAVWIRKGGAYIGAAYFFTSSTSFANPAITIGRMLSDTFAGIAPASVPMFVLMQLIGGALGLALIKFLYPGTAALADEVAGPVSTP